MTGVKGTGVVALAAGGWGGGGRDGDRAGADLKACAPPGPP
jgi:hypothetical protein